MKREILFRGYSEALNKWVEGNLINRFTDNDPMGIKYKSDFSSNLAIQVNPESFENCRIHEVHPDSVGQFTGLVDKNGVKIFEGDKLEWTSSNPFSLGEIRDVQVNYVQAQFWCYGSIGIYLAELLANEKVTITGNTFKPN